MKGGLEGGKGDGGHPLFFEEGFKIPSKTKAEVCAVHRRLGCYGDGTGQEKSVSRTYVQYMRRQENPIVKHFSRPGSGC